MIKLNFQSNCDKQIEGCGSVAIQNYPVLTLHRKHQKETMARMYLCSQALLLKRKGNALTVNHVFYNSNEKY